MKKKILILSILTLFLTSCKDKYEHTVEPTPGALFLYIFVLCIILPLLGLGISFLIRGIRRLKRNPPIASGKKLTITGGIFAGVAITLVTVFTITYFPNNISIPNASKYNTPEKAMKAATISDKCEFSVAQESHPNYYKDQDFLLRDAIKDIKNFKTTSNFRKVDQNCDSFHYYVSLHLTDNYDVLPFIQVSIFANGNFFIDYVKSQDNGTVSYYYKMDATQAETLVEYAYTVRSKYIKDNNKADDEFKAKIHEEGKIENFFKKAATTDNINYLLAKDKDLDNRSVYFINNFKKELFEIIADFNYTEVNDMPSAGKDSKQLLQYNYSRPSGDYDMPWQFTLILSENNEYSVTLIYYYQKPNSSSYSATSLYYTMNSSQGEGLYDVVKENQTGGTFYSV